MRIGTKKGKKNHGLSNTRIYKTWCDMRVRCENKQNKYYHNYGGRGITICPEWLDFRNFYSWAMSAGYNDTLTIERLDNASGYMPENCVFVDRTAQGNNKRNNRIFHVFGEDLTLAQIIRKYNVTKKTVYDRYSKGLRGDDLVMPAYFYHKQAAELRYGNPQRITMPELNAIQHEIAVAV